MKVKILQNLFDVCKSLYNIAASKGFYSFCDFLNNITTEIAGPAWDNIKAYMIGNIELVTDKGLLKICFDKLSVLPSKNDLQERVFNREFWERCSKEIFELYRMIGPYNQKNG